MTTQSPAPMKGVFAAALTPLNKDLSVDGAKLVGHCRRLLANGCDGLAVLGTTGEASSFSVGERIGILETLREAGIAGSALMPGVGCCSIVDTVELSRHAVAMDVGGVLMLPPFYYKNVSDDGLFAAYSEVIERVGDARLRIYLYNFPQMSAVAIGYALIERLLKRYPDTIAGIKDSSGVFDNMAGAAAEFPGFGVFSGSDDFLLPLLQKGGVGCITAVCNIACDLSARLYRAWRRGEPGAGDLQEQLVRVRRAAAAYPYSAGLKTLLAAADGDESWRTVRPPLVMLDETQAADLIERVAATGHTLPGTD